jgi:Nitroreductase family
MWNDLNQEPVKLAIFVLRHACCCPFDLSQRRRFKKRQAVGVRNKCRGDTMSTIHPTLSYNLARMLVSDAVLAPSSHNTQPWLFDVGNRSIDLIADRQRALPVNDPDDRELTISCGCALLNLRVAAASAGYSAQITTFAEPDDADLLARIHLAPADWVQPDAALHRAIGIRRTIRERFRQEPVEATAVDKLVAAAAQEGATLNVLSSAEQRLRAAELVAEGDAIQWANPSWRRELTVWMHPRRRGDGLSLPLLALPFAQAVVRTFDMGHGIGAKDKQLADESPLLTVLSTDADTPSDWLTAGQALQRVLLTSIELGLQASYLNQPIQVATLRSRVHELIGGKGCAQMLIRWGRPLRDLPATPRRPVIDVMPV